MCDYTQRYYMGSVQIQEKRLGRQGDTYNAILKEYIQGFEGFIIPHSVGESYVNTNMDSGYSTTGVRIPSDKIENDPLTQFNEKYPITNIKERFGETIILGEHQYRMTIEPDNFIEISRQGIPIQHLEESKSELVRIANMISPSYIQEKVKNTKHDLKPNETINEYLLEI